MMKTRLFISLLLLTSVISFAGADIQQFYGNSRNGNIVIVWRANTESNVKQYVIERKSINGSYMDVGSVDIRNDHNYEYIDQSAFKSSDMLYVYRLRIVDNDGSVSHTWDITVAHNVSSVKRTWGSIKALFR
jgi:hypothetical protein